MPIIVTRGYSETARSVGGRTVRVPVAEERMVLAYMRSKDTKEILTSVPFYCRINGVMYSAVWMDHPPKNKPEALFENYWADNDGRCAKCGRLSGDHLSPYHRTKASCVFVEKIDRKELLRPYTL